MRVPRVRVPGLQPAGRARTRLLPPLLGVLVALAACTPLYVPPVPARLPVHEVAQLGDGSSLRYAEGTLTLHVVLERIPEAGWLAVQWFAPDGTEAASDSVWVGPQDVGEGRTLRLPSRVTVGAGEWRAIVSLKGDVLRQFRTTVSAPSP